MSQNLNPDAPRFVREPHVCPRRAESPLSHVDGYDDWERRGSLGLRTCTYCGGAHPDDALEAIADGVQVTPTDKNYKAYLDTDARHHEYKVYFQHFDEAHKRKLVELVNAKTVKFSHPGYFYVPPFFMFLDPLS